MPSGNNQLGPVLIRESGFSLRWHRLPEPKDFPLAEKIFYAIARGDQAGATILMKTAQPQDFERLLNITRHERLAGYLLTRLDDNSDWDEIAELRQVLNNQALQELSLYNHQSQQLALLSGMISDISADALFIKGPAVARTVYPSPQNRLSADFDIVVPGAALTAVCRRLEQSGFSRDLPDCSQLGVGPCLDPASLLVQPNQMFVACDALTYVSSEARVELKLDPVELGLCVDTGRMLKAAQVKELENGAFLSPAPPDQLLIALCHYYRDGFTGFRTELDIHLLAANLSQTEWDEFCRTCKHESLEIVAYTGLAVVSSRMNSPMPLFIVDKLRPPAFPLISMISFSLTPRFLWNQSSLPMLLLNAFFLGGTGRKLHALWSCLRPDNEFLTAYYSSSACQSKQKGSRMLTHWLVLALPAGVFRRTFGRTIWPESIAWANRTC